LIRRRIPDLLIIALLFVLPLIMFWQQTIGGRTLLPTENIFQFVPFATYKEVVGAPEPHNRLVSDLVLENYQWKSFIRENIGQGDIPLWNPHQFAGSPFLAAGQQSTLYPFSILYYVLPLPAAYGWFTVVQLWLAGLFMYLFMRGLNVGRFGAALAGAVYQLSAFFVISAVFPMIIAAAVWLPLLLLMVEFIIQQRPALRGRPSSLPWVVIGAGALGCNILAGHVEITYYTLLIAGYYAAARLVWDWWQKRTQRAASLQYMALRGVWLVAMVALGIGLGAVQFIPLFEFAGMNFRDGSASLDQVLGWAHPPRDVVQFVLPNFYGNPAHHSYYDIFTGRTVPATINALGNPIDTIDWGIKNYVEGALYLGILPLALAVYSLIDGVRTRRALSLRKGDSSVTPYRWIFALLTLVSLTFMFGLPTYAALYILPGISQLHSPFRWIFAVTLGVAVLAGFGADALIRSKHIVPLQRWARRFGYGLLSMGVLILTVLLLSRVFYGQIEPLVDRFFQAMALAPNAFADARMFYSYQFTNILTSGLMTLGTGAVFWWAGKIPHPKPLPASEEGLKGETFSSSSFTGKGTGDGVKLWQFLAVGLVGVDLMVASWGFNPASDPALLDFTPPAIEWLLQKQQEIGPFRYTTVDDPSLGERGKILNANLGMRYELDDVRGYDSIIPRQYVDYMQGVAPQVQLDFNRVSPLYPDQLATVDWGQLLLLNVRYVMTSKNISLADIVVRIPMGATALDFEGADLAYEDDAVRIWQLPAWMPRAYIGLNNFDPNGIGIPSAYEGATITQDSGREKLIDISLEDQTTAWLIVSETYIPGWRAFIRPRGRTEAEEQPLEVQRVNKNFIGAYVRVSEPGNYTVRLTYSPASFQLGLFGSFISGVLLVFMGGIYLWRLYIVRESQTSGVAVIARNSLAPIILSLFNRGIDFGFAFVMLRILGPEGSGIYFYAAFIFGWFDIFTNFGLNVFLTREVARDRSTAWRLLFNTSVLRFLLMGIGVGLLVVFLYARQNTPGSTPLVPEAVLAIGLLYVGLLPNSLSTGLSALFYAFEKAEIPAAITTIATISKATFGVAALALGYGVVGLAAVSIVTNVITLAVMAAQARTLTPPPSPLPASEEETSPPSPLSTRREGELASPTKADTIYRVPTERGSWRPEWGLIRRMVGESWPLMLNHFLATIFFQIDVVIIQAIHGDKMVGQYGVAYKWVAALNVIPAFFTMALLPVMSRQAHEDRPALKRNYMLAIKLLVSVALPLAVLFTFLAYTLTGILGGSEFLPDGAIATQLMIWSIPIGWINSLTQYVLIALNLQRRITWAFIVAVSFNIIANLIFIPEYGYRAAAIITIFSEAMLLVPFGLLLSGAFGRLPWVGMLWRPLAAAAAMVVVLLVGWPIQPFIALVVGTAAYIIVLFALRPLSDEEWARLSPLIPGRMRRFIKLSPPPDPLPTS
jgi:O-antigen/teichoic acid export membrane protein